MNALPLASSLSLNNMYLILTASMPKDQVDLCLSCASAQSGKRDFVGSVNIDSSNIGSNITKSTQAFVGKLYIGSKDNLDFIFHLGLTQILHTNVQFVKKAIRLIKQKILQMLIIISQTTHTMMILLNQLYIIIPINKHKFSTHYAYLQIQN